MSVSNRISEKGRVVALVALGSLFLCSILARGLVLSVAASILAAEVDRHEDAETERHGLSGNESAVPGVVLRRVLGLIEKRGNGATKVAWLSLEDASNPVKANLPKPTCMAIPTPRLSEPPMLLPFHATPWGTLG